MDVTKRNDVKSVEETALCSQYPYEEHVTSNNLHICSRDLKCKRPKLSKQRRLLLSTYSFFGEFRSFDIVVNHMSTARLIES